MIVVAYYAGSAVGCATVAASAVGYAEPIDSINGRRPSKKLEQKIQKLATMKLAGCNNRQISVQIYVRHWMVLNLKVLWLLIIMRCMQIAI